ncbi:hypothetical protein KSP39_PZI017168 [Platanthera zijinensis]|uniref:Uncharacterized protein n=1 Tax=Platanthera zijinensis TaxID=2320716 RepID=A0AAP0FZA3_9ASPA
MSLLGNRAALLADPAYSTVLVRERPTALTPENRAAAVEEKKRKEGVAHLLLPGKLSQPSSHGFLLPIVRYYNHPSSSLINLFNIPAPGPS